jgi:serine/threonine protein kinase
LDKCDLQLSSDFGEYELLGEIARGGMGVVFKARHRPLNRIVAIQMIRGGKLSSTQDLQRFHVEANAAAQLDHPGIIPVYEIGTHAGQSGYNL